MTRYLIGFTVAFGLFFTSHFVSGQVVYDNGAGGAAGRKSVAGIFQPGVLASLTLALLHGLPTDLLREELSTPTLGAKRRTRSWTSKILFDFLQLQRKAAFLAKIALYGRSDC